jgi:hypothetical protein
MNKEILRMQILAGIITEGQYKRLLEDEETINYILDKISTQGKDSLTPAEKTYLDNYSKGKKDLEKPYINNNIPEDLKEFLYDMVDQHLPEDAEDRDIIEFMWEDEFGEDMIITGVVLECDYDNSMFKIDSYENIYELEINKITKILNNTKFKYNLNKLNNIDFL